MVSCLCAAEEAIKEKPVWVGVSVKSQNQGGIDYLIGTVPEDILREIELDEYKRRFLRVSQLRMEENFEDELQGDFLVHHDCADRYDWGIILVQYEDILSIEFKKGDPLGLK